MTDVDAPGPSSGPPPGTRPWLRPYTARWSPALRRGRRRRRGPTRRRAPVLGRDAEALALTRGGRDLADAGEGADHLFLGGLREFLEPLQVGGGDQGDEGLAVSRHDDALTSVHHPVDQIGELSPGLRHRNLVGHAHQLRPGPDTPAERTISSSSTESVPFAGSSGRLHRRRTGIFAVSRAVFPDSVRPVHFYRTPQRRRVP